MSQIHHKIQDKSKGSGLSNQLSNFKLQEDKKENPNGYLTISSSDQATELIKDYELNENVSEDSRINSDNEESISELSHIFLPSSDSMNHKALKKKNANPNHYSHSIQDKPKILKDSTIKSHIPHCNFISYPHQAMHYSQPYIMNVVPSSFLAHNTSNYYTYYDTVSCKQLNQGLHPLYMNNYSGIYNFHQISPIIGCHPQTKGEGQKNVDKKESVEFDLNKANLTDCKDCKELKPINNASNYNSSQVTKFGKYQDIPGFLSNCNTKLKYINSVKGSKCLKKMLEFTDPGDIKHLFNKILQYLPQIITNNFGNYFCQEIITYISKSDRVKVWEILRRKLKNYCTHQFANHCIQALVEMTEDLEEEKRVICYLIPHFDQLAFNSNGTHILQKMLISFKDSTKEKLLECIHEKFEGLIFDSLGVCLIKKYIICLKDQASQKKHEFISFIAEWIHRMIIDMFGHYAILCILQEWDEKYATKISDITWNNLLFYSSNKYGSRIVERLLETSTSVSPYLYSNISGNNKHSLVEFESYSSLSGRNARH